MTIYRFGAVENPQDKLFVGCRMLQAVGCEMGFVDCVWPIVLRIDCRLSDQGRVIIKITGLFRRLFIETFAAWPILT